MEIAVVNYYTVGLIYKCLLFDKFKGFAKVEI